MELWALWWKLRWSASPHGEEPYRWYSQDPPCIEGDTEAGADGCWHPWLHSWPEIESSQNRASSGSNRLGWRVLTVKHGTQHSSVFSCWEQLRAVSTRHCDHYCRKITLLGRWGPRQSQGWKSRGLRDHCWDPGPARSKVHWAKAEDELDGPQREHPIW
jgi:hypothetical protein